MRGKLRYHEPMARHTSWRAGGAAERYYEPADLDDLAEFLKQTPAEEPLLWLGLGSNLLIRDGGFRGTVVCTTGMLNSVRIGDEPSVYAQAGVSCAKIARVVARHAYTGTEFLAGIPGTLGGALAMNAGAFGSEIWERVIEAETINRYGQQFRRRPGDYSIAYRQVLAPENEWFVAASLRLEPDPSRAGEKRIRRLLAQRQETQPIGQASCGSVFRNPTGDFAARLIEDCGLKGRTRGRCSVSLKHANFIINEGGASASDIEALMQEVRRSVWDKYGVELIPEVKIVGEHG